MDHLRPFVTVLLGTLAVLSVSLVNGFPLVYADTGTYLASAFERFVPVDRPYWYGLFIRVLSFGGATVWPVVTLQATLCTIAVWRIAQVLVPQGRTTAATLTTCLLLAPITGLGWHAGQLMPDILTAIGAVSIAFLALRRDGIPWRAYDIALVLLACWCHLSNLVILPLVGLVAVRLRPASRRPAMVRVVLLALAAWGGLAAANAALTGQAHLSRGGHVFLMGRLVDSGILPVWLHEHCTTESFGICAYADSLPSTSRGFLWHPDSPLQRQGGWEATREEYGRIVRGTLTEPRYLLWHVRSSIASTAQQLVTTGLADGVASPWFADPSTPPHRMITRHLPHLLPAFIHTWQTTARGRPAPAVFDAIHRWALLLSALAGLLLALRKSTPPPVRTAVLLAFATTLIGAWACASLSVVDARYLPCVARLSPVPVALVAGRTDTARG